MWLDLILELHKRKTSYLVHLHLWTHYLLQDYFVILIFYLASGVNSVSRFMVTGSIEFIESALLCLVRANSVAKVSFSSVTITLMIGLSLGFKETHAIAISTAFQAELMSKSPLNLSPQWSSYLLLQLKRYTWM